MVKLYQRGDCPFCWKVRLALEELRLSYDSLETVLGEKHPDVQALSPTGTVPVLVAGDTAIWESTVIVEYLEQCAGGGRLIPAEAGAAAQVRLMHAYSDRQVGQALRDIVFEKRSKLPADRDEALISRGREAWRQCQAFLERNLAQSEWFGGDQYSAADCALGARFGVAAAYDEGVGSEFPGLQRWYSAVTSRPGWREAYPDSFIGPQ